jgi:hydroxymethylbilane synthase
LLTLGTRASALALAQTELTRAALERAFPRLRVEVQTFTTRGDRKLDLDLRNEPAGGKGLFTKELEEALLAGTIDVAVHSLKDLPGHNPPGLGIAAVLERAATDDVLISKHPGGLETLRPRDRIGTSSVRRARQLTWARPDLQIEQWRGNVQTRLRKLTEAPEVAGIVLARAGLDRLGFDLSEGRLTCESAWFYVTSLAEQMLPAIGQGVIALQSRSDREEITAALQAVNHDETFLAVRAERELQRLLAGDCTLPVGVRTLLAADTMEMRAILFGAEGVTPREAHASGSRGEPERIAAELFAQLSNSA